MNLAERLSALLQVPVTSFSAAGAQHGVSHATATLAGGRKVFVKSGGDFAAEAAGLRWLAQAGAVPVPEVLGADSETLVIEWVPPGRCDEKTASRFGGELARMHAAGAAGYGAPWPGVIASLPLDNTVDNGSWSHWYGERRLLPFLHTAFDRGALGADEVRLVEDVIDRLSELGGPPEPPARIHGDCWSGNVLWSGGRAWLIDPAAHGGHRETDLAMLALFGAPHLELILAAYADVAPLADGWRRRVPLHQLHPLLVHACLFGGAYRPEVVAAARAALSARLPGPAPTPRAHAPRPRPRPGPASRPHPRPRPRPPRPSASRTPPALQRCH